jgi:prepilin-type processing-associated H-X9-DG protein
MAGLGLLLLVAGTGQAEAGCARQSFMLKGFVVCEFDLAKDHLALFNLDSTGQPLASFTAIDVALAGEGKRLNFAMNAGMFDQNLKPIGYYVENGVQAKKLNRRNGPGNFHMKPNGVFYMADGKAGVMETEAYSALKVTPEFATQSGPMLVIDGALHPAFSETGTSYKLRNGVGVVDETHVVFAISEGGVNFYEFASLFRDQLKCANALFFDGSVSSLYSAELSRNDGFVALGPMVGAWEMR